MNRTRSTPFVANVTTFAPVAANPTVPAREKMPDAREMSLCPNSPTPATTGTLFAVSNTLAPTTPSAPAATDILTQSIAPKPPLPFDRKGLYAKCLHCPINNGLMNKAASTTNQIT